MPTLTIFAGTNGSGKSTLYTYQKSINNKADLGIRVNPDEILKNANGDWRSTKDSLKAAKTALTLIRDCIKNKQSFNWETTVFTRFNINLLKLAKEQGFKINLYYVGVNSATICVERVAARIMAGGHGIPERTIRQRYGSQFHLMSEALEYIDNAVFLDNSSSLKIVATYIDNMLTYSSESIAWVKNLPYVCDQVDTAKEV